MQQVRQKLGEQAAAASCTHIVPEKSPLATGGAKTVLKEKGDLTMTKYGIRLACLLSSPRAISG